MALLSRDDEIMLPLALRHNNGFHLATEWYLGWKPMPHQWAFHMTPHPNTTLVQGIATGKTTGVAASFTMDCLTIPYFMGLNTSVTAKQAELPFEMFMTWFESRDQLKRHVEDIIQRPFPIIKFKNYSELHFRTAGQDARFIRGFEYDRINYDEAGLDPDGEAVSTLRGRLRGARPDGSKRMARLDVVTSPTDALWLIKRFERGVKDTKEADLKNYLSMRVETYENIHLTKQQIELMEAEYPEEMIDVEMRGFFPDFGSSMFPSGHLRACRDLSINDEINAAIRPESGEPLKGWIVDEHPRHGIVHFERPVVPGHLYVEAGDPGIDNPPKRNSPVVMVFDVTSKPYKLVYFDWISGKGSYMPFLNSFKYADNKYHPIYKGIDSTGPQKALEELAFENVGIRVDGLNFSRDKDAMLNALSLAISNHEMRWPAIKGLDRQLAQYNRETDKKLPQDIVMSMAEIAFLSRYIGEDTSVYKPPRRRNFVNRHVRTNGSRRR